MWLVRIYKIELDNFIMFSYKIPHYVSLYKYHDCNTFKFIDYKKVKIRPTCNINYLDKHNLSLSERLNFSITYAYNIEQFKTLVRTFSELYYVDYKTNYIYYDDDKHPLIFSVYFDMDFLFKIKFPRNYKNYPIPSGYIVNPNNHKMVLYDNHYLSLLNAHNKYLTFLYYFKKSKIYEALCDDLVKIIYSYIKLYEQDAITYVRFEK